MNRLVVSLATAWMLCSSAGSERIFHSRDRSDIRVAHRALPIVGESSAQKFLARYGWMQPVNWEEASQQVAAAGAGEDLAPPDPKSTAGEDTEVLHRVEPSSNQGNASPAFTEALKEFQESNGLPVTGVVDAPTREAMNVPRCGVPDKRTSPHVPPAADRIGQAAEGRASVTGSKFVRKKRFLYRFFYGQRPRGRRTEVADGNVSGLVFGKRRLKWRLLSEGYSSQMSVTEQRAAIRMAFRLWSEVTPIDFEEDQSSSVSAVDITLGFGTGRHLGCSQAFDGAGQEVAHSWQNGAIHFDDDEHFTAANSNQGISLLRVAVHEVGHVLGLPHTFIRGSVMQPNYGAEGRDTELAGTDRKAIQRLYGLSIFQVVILAQNVLVMEEVDCSLASKVLPQWNPATWRALYLLLSSGDPGVCEGPFDTVFDWVRRERGPDGKLVVAFNTYFFRDSWYWMYENRNNRTRYGDPLPICAGWHGIPRAGIDAFVHVCTRSKEAAYFFKGTQYWRYDNVNDRAYTQDPHGVSYPRLISSGFPGITGPINAAFFDRRDQSIYFFKDSLVTAFNVNTNLRVPGFPKRIIDVFPPVEPGDHPLGSLDAVYYSYTHRAVFFLKGVYFWRVVNWRERLANPSLPYNGLRPKRKVSGQWLDICDVHTSALT